MKFIFTLLLWFSALYGPAPHPFHVAISQAEWDANDSRIKLSHKLFLNDVEAYLLSTKEIDQKFTDKASAKQAMALAAFAEREFKIHDEKGDALEGNWLGCEIEDDLLWLFIEYPLKRKRNKVFSFNSNLLFKHFSDQLNIVHFSYLNNTKSLHFNSGDTDLQTISIDD